MAQAERVLFVLLADVDVLQNVAPNLPRARQVIGALRQTPKPTLQIMFSNFLQQ